MTTFRTLTRTSGNRTGAFSARTLLLVFLLGNTLSGFSQSPAQPTTAQPAPSPAPPAEPRQGLTPEEIEKLKQKWLEHEDWTKLSIKSLGLESWPPMPGGTVDRPQFRRELIRLEWRADDPVDLFISLPKGVRKPRVILYLYGYPSDASRFTTDDWCKGATESGFAAVGFVLALTGERYRHRPLKEWFISELQESLATSTHDVQMVLNYLQTRTDLNMDRVATYGQGSGASIAILAASVDPRIQVLDLLNPWGDWPDWLKQSAWISEDERPNYLRPEFLEKVAMLDPTQVLPKLTTPVVRLQQVKDDRITPTAAREKIAAAIPHGATLLQSDSWPDYWKAFKQQKLWNWAKERLEPTPAQEQSAPKAGQ